MSEVDDGIDGKGEEREPEHEGDREGVDRCVVRDAETTAESGVAKVAEPSAEYAEDGSTDDVAGIMNAKVDAGVAIEHGIQHHCPNQ